MMNSPTRNFNNSSEEDDEKSVDDGMETPSSSLSKVRTASSSEDEVPLSSLLLESLDKQEEENSVSNGGIPFAQKHQSSPQSKMSTVYPKGLFTTKLEQLIFVQKKLPLFLITYYDDIYRVEQRDKKRIPSKGTRFYVGTHLFPHFPGLKEWVSVVHFMCDGWNYVKEPYENQDNKSSLISKDISRLDFFLKEMVPDSKDNFEIYDVTVETITHPSETDDPDPTSSHNDTFEIISKIILKPSCGRSILSDKAFFVITSQRTGEYDQDVRPLPKDSYATSYDPIVDFDSKRPIVFSPWMIYNDVSSSHSSDVKNKNVCTFCTENKSNVVAYPCGHVFSCSRCKLMMEKTEDTRCAICRKGVKDFVTLIYN